MSELPKWPNVDDFTFKDWGSDYLFAYERARAEAAMARLRVAVEALNKISAHLNGPSAVPGHKTFAPLELSSDCVEYADEALQQIGELPI